MNYLHIQRPSGFFPKFEVVSCYCEVKGKILLLLRQTYKFEGGKWGPPAGKLLLGESLGAAITRELREETGILVSMLSLRYLHVSYLRYPEYDFLYHTFRLLLDEQPFIILNLEEHQSFQWLLPQEAVLQKLVLGEDESIQRVYF